MRGRCARGGRGGRGGRGALRRLVAIGLVGAAGLASALDLESERRAGDRLSLALPALTLGATLARHDGAGAGQFLRSYIATVGTVELLKHLTDVPRPDGSNTLSFPSGHASRAFAAAAFVHRRYGWSEAWPLYAAGVWVGHTRVRAGRHRWGDVAGSLAVALATSHWIVEPRHGGDALAGLGAAPHRGGLALVWSMPLAAP